MHTYLADIGLPRRRPQRYIPIPQIPSLLLLLSLPLLIGAMAQGGKPGELLLALLLGRRRRGLLCIGLVFLGRKRALELADVKRCRRSRRCRL